MRHLITLLEKHYFLSALLMLLVLLILPQVLPARSGGVFTTIEGRVDVLKPGVIRGVAVSEGDPVNINDVIRTKSNSFAVITMPDQSILKIAPNSRVSIASVIITGAGERKTSTVTLLKGVAESVVTKTKRSWYSWFDREDSSYKVETHNSIIGVKGTNFGVLFAGGSTTVFVDSGLIYVQPKGGGNAFLITQNLLLGANEVGIIGRDGSVSKTSDVPKGILKILKRGGTGSATSQAQLESLRESLQDSQIIDMFFTETDFPGGLIPITSTHGNLLYFLNTTPPSDGGDDGDGTGGPGASGGSVPVTFTGIESELTPGHDKLNGDVWGQYDGKELTLNLPEPAAVSVIEIPIGPGSSKGPK